MKDFLRVQVNFSAYDFDGRGNGFDTLAYLDTSEPLIQEAEKAARDWIESRNRCFGSSLRLSMVMSAFWQDSKGYWEARHNADGTNMSWDSGQ